MTAALLAVLLLFAAAGCTKTEKKEESKSDFPADGVYQIEVTLTGGTGRATVASPAKLRIQDGKMTATIIWSSKNYDYMLVDDVRYDAEIIDDHSVFEIPVSALDTELPVVGDTMAMSVPHEIEYTLKFDSSTMKAASGEGS